MLILAAVKTGYGGNHYTYSATSGVLNIVPTSVTPSLQPGDTLDFPAAGNYVALNVTNVQGLPGDSIVLRFLPGAVVTTNLGFVLGDWTNVSYVKIIGYNIHNHLGTPIALRGKCHSITFDNFSIVNDYGNYADHPAIVADDMYGGQMNFSGSKDQTFYEIEFKHGTIEGYKNTDVVRLGTDNNRSICTDFVFADVEFRNITNTYQTPGVPIAGTCYNLKVYDCLFEDIMSDPGSVGVHGGCIFLYGYVEAYNNQFRNVYANDIRLCPLQWTGIPGYSGPNARTKVYNNISSHQRSYSFMETSPNNAGPRLTNGGGKVVLGGTDVYNNTVYYTNRASYNGDYYGYIVDVYADSVRVYNNVIIAPEVDRPWSPSTRNYMVSMPGATRYPFDSSGNRVYRTLFEAGVTDTVNWTLSSTSPLVNKASNVVLNPPFDIHYLVRPQGIANDIGAVELSSVPPGDIPPVANAGADTVLPGPGTVTLDGSGSYDANDTIVKYKWTKVSGPANVTIAYDTAKITTVTGFTPGVYVFQLLVTDSFGATGADQVQVTINLPPNQLPVANAGPDHILPSPAPDTLDASASSDPDGTITQYRWVQISGATASISNSSAIKPVITGLQPGTYVFQLTVTDDRGGVSKDSITVTVNGSVNQLPVADAGADTVLAYTTTSSLNGSASYDPDGTIVQYAWTQISGPGGLSTPDANVVNPTLNGLQAGVYVFKLTVTDNQGAVDADTVQMTINPLPNQLPVANAGNDQVLAGSSSTTLDGSASYDPDGNIAQFNWAQTGGAGGVTISGNVAKPVVSGLVPGIYMFKLTVTDNRGGTAEDSVQVTVNAPPPNQPPVANAGGDQTVPGPGSTMLDGSGSYDPDGSIVQYSWSQTFGNPATISNTGIAKPGITGLTPGVYVFQLVVTDNLGATATDNMQITVNTPPNQSPVANAGSDQVLTGPGSAVLDGSASYDPDGSIAQYSWTQTAGTTVTIVNAATAGPTVNGLQPGSYTFRLTVTDNRGATASDDVQITVNTPPSNQSPVANAGQDTVLTSGPANITLNGSGSYDPDGSISTYNWSQSSGPGGTTIVNSNTATPGVTGLQAGTYVFQLNVTDNLGASSTGFVQVKVNPVVLATYPVAIAGNDTTISYPSATAVLNGTRSYSTNGTIVGWTWKQVAGPSVAVIQQSHNAVTSIGRLSTGGDYQFELTIVDDKGMSAKSIVKVSVFVPLRYTGSLKIYPNPVVTDKVTLDGINDDMGKVNISIIDISGKLIRQMQVTKSSSTFHQEIDMSSLIGGMYILQVEFAAMNHSYTFKILKQ